MARRMGSSQLAFPFGALSADAPRSAAVSRCRARLLDRGRWLVITQERTAVRPDTSGRTISCGWYWCATNVERSAASLGGLTIARRRVARWNLPPG
jgi:hypothetical protein